MLNKMKKFQFLALSLFAVFACVSFASCSDDDKDEPTADIVGTWECITGEDHGAGYPRTAEAVRVFQSVFNLPPNGIVDYPTWYKISEIYVGVSRISEPG